MYDRKNANRYYFEILIKKSLAVHGTTKIRKQP